MKSNVKKIWIGILILAIACLATIACVIGVKASNVVDESILNLEENADTVVNRVLVPMPKQIKFETKYNGKEQAPDLNWFEDTGYEYRIIVTPKRTPGSYTLTLRPQANTADTQYYLDDNGTGVGSKIFRWTLLSCIIDKNGLFSRENIVREYNGEIQSPKFIYEGLDISDCLQIDGEIERVASGIYYITISIRSEHSQYLRWDDKTIDEVSGSWRIEPKLIEPPTFVTSEFTYNGKEQKVEFNPFDTSIIHVIIAGTYASELRGIESGYYSVFVNLKDNNNYRLNANVSNGRAELIWRIIPKTLTKPTVKNNLTYNGSQQTVAFNNFDTGTMSVSGNSGTDAKTYNATLSLKDKNNYVWSTGGNDILTLSWRIDPKAVIKPSFVAGQSFVYNGNNQTINLNSYDNTAINITGTNSATNAGSYSVTASLKSTNYKWSDNTTTSVLLSWTISPKAFAKPSITGSLTYNGSEQTIAINNFDAATMNVGGNKGTIAGIYNATISLKSTTNYKWSDNTTANFTLPWTIGRKSVAQPTALANNVFVHTGSNLSYIPNGFDASQMNIQGNVQSEVGKYTASVTPNSNHMWSNGTTTAVTFDFEIIPAGITLRQNVYVDYIYNDNGTRKSYGVTYRHKLNDSELNIVNGETRYILGNIKAGTSIGDFLQSLLTDSNLLVIKDVKGNVLYDGLNNILDLNKLVATGYEVILFKDNTGAEILDRVYLSVLGDLTGDGQINSADMAMLNRILSHEIDITNFSLELQLATMLNNNGMLSSIDREIMHNIVKNIDENENYFGDKELTSDYVIFELNGNTRINKVLTTSSLVQGAVVGNISQGTTANEFISKMQAQGINISLSDMHRANNASLNGNDIVGTGCYFTYNGNKIYLTILGDLTGDGRVNSQDRLVINKVVSGSKKFDDMINAVKLACLINNNGAVTSTDSEIIWQSIIGAVDINKYIY